ncbi:ABC-type transport system involved in resistance to organic solvents, periplasmic component USSDB6C [plant metagenome]|uniref:ABC-type transport system involved in resistance to organic solvents, periplasmic component USSDB6C n=1 Tax=plant metagenome TaxID=1297885 RepID=A0A484RLZ4_9ZZZZ
METRAHHVLIGLFTLLAVSGALIFGLWLAKAHGDGGVSYYRVVFNEPVNGLSRGSAVQYSGIRVGDVVALSLDPNDPRRVIARIRVEDTARIKEDTNARLMITGITGAAAIELGNGTPESPLLKPKPDSNEEPVIVATPSQLSKLLANGEDLMGNLNEIIFNAKQLFSKENIESISKTLANLEQATGAMADQRDSFRELLAQLTQASKEGQAALKEATSLIKNTNQLVAGEGAATLKGARDAMTSLANATSRIETLLETNQPALNRGMQGFSEIGPAVRELRSTLSALNAIARRLEDNPANYILGRESLEEFRP